MTDTRSIDKLCEEYDALWDYLCNKYPKRPLEDLRTMMLYITLNN